MSDPRLHLRGPKRRSLSFLDIVAQTRGNEGEHLRLDDLEPERGPELELER